tara:strand:- start:75 stop:275 length:201 start_codon:yes stop_codon:yes gene_type:complete
MKIERKSNLSGEIGTMELDVTEAQMARFYSGNELVQTIFPNLSSEEREFLISGILPSEWATTFGDC